jgi:rfaE bifunctional protein kinase chain/domain
MKTIFVSGNFNILHPGHLRLLRFARELGDKLIVGVHSDLIGGSDAHVPEYLRLEGIRSNNWVSEAVLVDEPVTEVIRKIKPDIVVKGKEHINLNNPELEVLKEYGGELLFSSGEVTFSSLDLIRKDLSDFDDLWRQFPEGYIQRHNFDNKDLIEIVKKMESLKVCVIGDLIVDEYITCDPLGMSQEDPTIVVTPVDTQKFLGGSGIVAAHAANLGAEVEFFSITGEDEARSFVEKELINYKVNNNLIIDESRPTTVKQRYRSQGKTLLRVSHLHQGSISSDLQKNLYQAIEKKLPDMDLIVYSDFNYGCLPQPLVELLTKKSKELGIVQAADSQCSSQIGDVSRFKGMDLLTATELEARISLGNQEDGLVIIAENLRDKSSAQNIIIKLADEGILIHSKEKELDSKTDRLPALNDNPKDVAGAGDSMLITSALTMAAGGTFGQAAAIGSFAAGLQVSRLGNLPLSKEEMIKTLTAVKF